ncbi:PH domain-containing protein [Sphingomonas sp. BGYR3]|uniref:PH domain-containing protein n=1 Tax=Sphingomonas sp. BGYR3 TaxID=2975483 RepID=UPI0021A82871|nr:PH domain-containing protein [Sphingomonas sp. BGYR3]MDG5489300.1 PH domain-containing protein [Sphingomonas sp. BGYR3]
MADTIDRFRSSTRGWLLGTLAGWGTLALTLGGLLVSFYFQAQGMMTGAAWLGPVALVTGLVLIALRWLANIGTGYEVTADRLVLRQGIIAKSIDEIELYRIKNVRIDFTILNQMVDIGTLTIGSSDETTATGPLVMRDIPRARARREALRERVNAARQARGVREIDLAEDRV